MKRGLFLLFSLFLLPSSLLKGQDPFIRHYSVHDGLPSNTVYQAIQDKSKFIWFATDAGVARFDGSEFKTYTSKEGLLCEDIIKIFEDLQGRIWFIGINGMIFYYYDGRIYNHDNAPFLLSLETSTFFRRVYQDKDSVIYFHNNHNTIKSCRFLDPHDQK